MGVSVVTIAELIEHYVSGPQSLRKTVEGMTGEQLDASPIVRKWTTRQVISHIADFELVYSDRMKRVIAEEVPTFFGGDPDTFAARLIYEQRDVEHELRLVEDVRRHMTRILTSISEADFQRVGNHSEDGLMTLETLLRRITEHIPHHLRYIVEKQKALGM